MERIKRLYINIWNGCNLSCRHCFNEGGRTGGKLLDGKEIINLLSAASRELGVEEVQLTGGEPTLRPDLFEILDELLNLNLSILLQTNGAFGAEVRDGLIRFRDRGLRLIVSLDGTVTNDILRGEGATAKTIGNIKFLSKLFPVRVNILLSSLIEWREVEEIAALARGCGFLLAFNPVCPSGRAQASLLMPRNRYFEWMRRLEELKTSGIETRKCFDFIGDRLREVEKCPVRAGNALVVGADGDVYPCGFLINVPEALMGNVRKTSLTELLKKTPSTCRELNEDCRECGQLKDGFCNGGCPARIFALNGDFTSREYYCAADYERRVTG